MVKFVFNLIRNIYNFHYNLAKTIYYFWNYYKRERHSFLKRKFEKFLNFYRLDLNNNNGGILLVQMSKDFEYTIKMASASKALASKYNLIIRLHDPQIFWTKKQKYFDYVFTKLFINSYYKVHLAFSDSVDFKNSTNYSDQYFIRKELAIIIRQLQKPSDILTLKFEEILVGDLIYDTYLRFYHKPTITEINTDVIYVIEIALNIFFKYKKYIQNNKVKILVNTYTTYIQHGITARLSLFYGIDVYSVAYGMQQISNDFPYHHINHTLFSKKKALTFVDYSLAKKKLESRFSGKIDSATSYMRKSAFTNNPLSLIVKQQFNIRPRNIVIYMHEFYDSPHINRVLQFPDLYLYLKSTLEQLINLVDTSVFIKLHPNSVIGCRDEAIALINSFNANHFYILDEQVSNLNIIDLKPDLICTARGTVGIEMAFHDIPTVALFDNIYSNFDFVHTCYDKESYFSILKGEIKPTINYNKEQIISFYFQAYIEKIPQDNNSIFFKLSTYTFKFDTYSDEYLKKLFEDKDLIFCNDFIDYYSSQLI
jgi:hypothetical protein